MSRLPVTIPENSIGDYSIRKEGNYTVLHKRGINGIMQDTEREFEEHSKLWEIASGDILIGGLGIGMVNEYFKDQNQVTSVTIIEKFQEVIDMVWDSCYKDSRFRLVKADIETWEPDTIFDIGWFDTWLTDHPTMSLQQYKEFMITKYSPYCKQILTWKPLKD